MKVPVAIFALFFSAAALLCSTVEDYARIIAPLIDPTKLSTLKPRGANERVQKITFHLADARAARVSPAKVVDAAIKSVGMTNRAAAQLTKSAMLRNVRIAEKYGCLDKAGLEAM